MGLDLPNKLKAVRFLVLISLVLLIVFLALDWISFLFLDPPTSSIVSGIVKGLKLSSSFISLLVVFLILDHRRDQRDQILLISVFLLFHLADHFMVWQLTLQGIIVFMISQCGLVIRHLGGWIDRVKRYGVGKDLIYISIITAFLIIAYATIIGMLIVPMMDSLFLRIAVMIYGFILSFSILSALMVPRIGRFKGWPGKYIVIGVVLFSIGDILVGLRVASSGSTLSSVAGNLIWLFYLPAILLIGLSGYRRNPFFKTQGPL